VLNPDTSRYALHVVERRGGDEAVVEGKSEELRSKIEKPIQGIRGILATRKEKEGIVLTCPLPSRFPQHIAEIPRRSEISPRAHSVSRFIAANATQPGLIDLSVRMAS